MKRTQKIYHVHCNNGSGADYYFSSVAAIYTHFTPSTLGISQAALYRQFANDDDVLVRTEQCEIYKGTIIKTTRKT